MKKRIKICILSSAHAAFDVRIFYKQAKTLARAGYDVTLIAQHGENETIDAIKIIALPGSRNRLERIFFTTWWIFIKALREKSDIYHFHDPDLLHVGMLLKYLTKAKVIYDVHEDYPKAILTKNWLLSIARKPVSHIFNFVEKLSSCWLDYIIAATDNIAKGFKNGKITIIRNYPILKSIQSKSKFDFERPTLIYEGGLAEERGISQIVQAMEYVSPSRNIKLILCGKFFPESYQKKVRKLRGFDKVEYLGWIEPEEVWLKINQATFGIVCFLPKENHIKAMPNKLFEYMAAGLPVIASNFPLWKEIVEGNKCGLTVNPIEPIEIAKAVEYLIEHPQEARKMGENGRKAVLEKYNWENESKKLLKVYEKLIKQ